MTPEEIAEAQKLIDTPITAESIKVPVVAVFPTPVEDIEVEDDGA